MAESGLLRNKKQSNVENDHLTDVQFDHEYEVKNEDGVDVGVHLLQIHYGELWKATLNRVIKQIDGFMFTISHQGYKFNVYRRINNNDTNIYPPLRLVRNIVSSND